MRPTLLTPDLLVADPTPLPGVPVGSGTRPQVPIDRLPLACLLSGPDLRYIRWNPAAERLFGFAEVEVVGRHPFDVVVPPASRPLVAAVFDRLRAGDMAAHGVCENVTRSGRVVTCRWHNTPLFGLDGRFAGFVSLAEDVTEQLRLEEQLRQAQKLEVIGRLAGGVAHDFNNLLTIINGYGELLTDALPAGDPNRALVEELRTAGRKAAALTGQLLAFSRKQPVASRVLDLREVVAETDRMLRRVIGEDVELVAEADDDLGAVRADPGSVEQVLMNLALNARDAMPRGGRLTIGLRNVDRDGGRFVRLAVSDTGHGIPAEVRPHLFEPFFTTKDPGRGTGLGLAVVHGVVTQAGGSVEVASEPGAGSTFAVYFPRASEAAVPGRSGLRRLPMPRGTETVLLVEDEDAVRALVRSVLDSCGYRVLAAADGDDAIRAADAHPGPIHLLVTDVVMPVRDGREVAEWLTRRHPAAGVLYLSGYTDDAVVRHGVTAKGADFLQKPFLPAVLAQTVREILDRPTPG